MPLALILNWRVWAAMGLIISHWFAYHQGGLFKQVQLDRYINEQKTVHIAALDAARTTEQILQLAKQKAENDYQNIKRKSAAAAADTESERVLLITALDAARATTSNSTTTSGVDANPAERILRESIGRYEEVAQNADQLSNQVTGLQDYVRNVCIVGSK